MRYCLLCIALAAPLAHGQPTAAAAEEAPIDALKREYLRCSDAALAGQLGTGAIRHCSEVYEELKRRAFGGDFLRLLAWSSAQSGAQRTGN